MIHKLWIKKTEISNDWKYSLISKWSIYFSLFGAMTWCEREKLSWSLWNHDVHTVTGLSVFWSHIIWLIIYDSYNICHIGLLRWNTFFETDLSFVQLRRDCVHFLYIRSKIDILYGPRFQVHFLDLSNKSVTKNDRWLWPGNFWTNCLLEHIISLTFG